MKDLIAFLAVQDYIAFGHGALLPSVLDQLSKIRAEQLPVLVCASSELAQYARSLGFYLQSWRGALECDWMVDQVDWVTEQGFFSFGSDGVIKERKLVRTLAKNLIALVDHQHFIHGLTNQEFYAEVLPQASSIVARSSLKIGAQLRYLDKETQDGHWLMSFNLTAPWKIEEKIKQLNEIPCLFAHGLSEKVADRVYGYDCNDRLSLSLLM
jgi:ribose 5-phosphate isomerase